MIFLVVFVMVVVMFQLFVVVVVAALVFVAVVVVVLVVVTSRRMFVKISSSSRMNPSAFYGFITFSSLENFLLFTLFKVTVTVKYLTACAMLEGVRKCFSTSIFRVFYERYFLLLAPLRLNT